MSAGPVTAPQNNHELLHNTLSNRNTKASTVIPVAVNNDLT